MSSTLMKSLVKSCFKAFPLKQNHTNVRLASYKAAALKELGKPLVIEEQKKHSLKKNQIRIAVQYCSVNSIDITTFETNSSQNLPFIPGYELSGEVIEIGKGIKKEDILMGERVAALSLDKFGGFATECVVDIKDVWRLPSNVDFKDAAVLICGHSTALYTFSKLHELKKDSKVVISAGPAGLGLAAIDVAANAYKAKVIAVTDTEDTSELMRSRGAFSAVKFNTKKLKEDVMCLTDDKGPELIYDAVGDYMFEPLGNCVQLNGKIFHAAPVIYPNIPPPPLNTYLMLVSLHALREKDFKTYRQVVSDVLDMADEGVLNAHVSAKFELKSVNDAIEYIKAKKCTGKVVIELD